MDVTLIYFSQTGNTRKVAAAMAGAFREAGHPARMLSLKKATAADAARSDLLGVGTACLSSQAPTPIKQFLRALAPLHERRAFVFATSSGAPGRVLSDLTRLLSSRGADVVGGFLTRGQVHHPAPHMTGQFPDRPNADDLTQARRFAVAVAEHVSARRPGPLPESRADALKRGWSFYDYLGLVSQDAVLRLLMPEPKLDPVKCDQCQWCIHECAMDNIALRPIGGLGTTQAKGRPPQSYPVLGDQCIRCYRCLTGCPQKAFDANWRLADPFLLLLYNATLMRWCGDLEAGEQIYGGP
jgi:flavodoxin/ferredoxin